jgi:AAA15 family ATPase/GTPase
MLIELYGKNFGCFRDEFRLSMVPTNIDPDSDRGIVEVQIEGEDEPLRLLRAVAIYGANASGKSTVIRATEALRTLLAKIRVSDSLLEPFEPFALIPGKKGVSELGIKAVVDGRIYDYEITYDSKAFASERLLWLAKEGPITLFDRAAQHVEGEWKRTPEFGILSNQFRPNALLLSLADALAPALAKNIAVGIRRLLRGFNPVPPIWPFESTNTVAKRVHEDAHFGAWLLAHLKSADIGVVDLKTQEHKEKERAVTFIFNFIDGEEEEKDRQKRASASSIQLSLFHRGQDGAFPIPYRRESIGTRRLIELAPLLYDLVNGPYTNARFIDEIGSSFHPDLLQGLIRHFNCEVAKKDVRGQLIFVTHETSLLDAEAKNAILRRDQIYLTEKDADGAARLYSVAEFKERNNLNIRRRYLQGRYGAIPSLGHFTE